MKKYFLETKTFHILYKGVIMSFRNLGRMQNLSYIHLS